MELKPLPVEGGLYRRGYCAKETIRVDTQQAGDGATRPVGTAIYFLLTTAPDSFSALHKLPIDEIYHFYLGDPVEMLLLYPDGSSKTVILGQDVLDGQQVQFVAPAGVWQGSQLLTREGADNWGFALLGTTMAPGFHESDYLGGEREALVKDYPDRRKWIEELTRPDEPLKRVS